MSPPENAVATQVVDAAYRIHRALGPGLFESVYEAVMAAELEKRGLEVDRQYPIPVVHEGIHFQAGFRADLLVENLVIVEVKSVAALADVHKKQMITYVRLSGKRLGLLINFNVALIKDGILRVANRLPEVP